MVFFFDALSLGALFDLGAWDELLQVADDIVRGSQQVGGRYAPVLAQPWITQVLLWRDRHDEASETAASLRTGAMEMRDAQVLVPAWVATALVAIHQGHKQDAIEIIGGARPGDRGLARLVSRELPRRPRPGLRGLGRAPPRPTARRAFAPNGAAASPFLAIGLRRDGRGLGGRRGRRRGSTNGRSRDGATTATRWRRGWRCSGPRGVSSGSATPDRATCARGPSRSSPGCKPNPRRRDDIRPTLIESRRRAND